MSNQSLELMLGVAATVAWFALLIVILLPTKGHRRSTVTGALNWVAVACVSLAIFCIADQAAIWWLGPWAEIALKLAGIIGIVFAAVQLFRLLPRAVAFRDRESLIEAADELRQSKERFDRALRGASSGLWEWNIEAKSIWYSPRYRELLGYESEDQFPNTFESWEAAVHPDDRQAVITAVERHLHHPEDFEIEFRMKTKSAGYRWYGCKGITIRGADGSPMIMSGSLQDIHEKKCLQQTTRKLDEYALQKHRMESLGELAGGIAHEFNNFLQAIGGQLQFIKRAIPETGELAREVTLATELLDQAAHVTRRFLAYGRQKAAQRQRIRPNSILEQLRAVLSPLMTDRVKIQIKRGARLGPICADPVSVQQALVNLCINARDAMPQGGTITLATEQTFVPYVEVGTREKLNPGKYIAFTVTDTGHGIAKKVQARLFEPFFSTKPRDKGTGLGLSIVKSIVEEHGGFVEFRSELNQGTTFKLWFPAARIRKSRNRKKHLAEDCRNQDITLLYVEDDRYIRRSIAHEFKRRGVRVILARNGRAAVRVFEQCPHPIDFAVLDFAMPEMNGTEAMRRLRTIRPGLPVIFCTAYAGTLKVDGVMNEKDTYLVEKPFQFPELWDLMHRAISQSDASRQILTIAEENSHECKRTLHPSGG